MTEYKKIIPPGREDFGETTYIQNKDLTAGQSFEGILKSVRTEQFTDDETGKVSDKKTYYLKQPDGSELGLNGCQSLDEAMALVSPGSQIKVEYNGRGKKKPGSMRKPPFLFAVYVAEHSPEALAKVS